MEERLIGQIPASRERRVAHPCRVKFRWLFSKPLHCPHTYISLHPTELAREETPRLPEPMLLRLACKLDSHTTKSYKNKHFGILREGLPVGNKKIWVVVVCRR